MGFNFVIRYIKEGCDAKKYRFIKLTLMNITKERESRVNNFPKNNCSLMTS